MNVKMIDRRTYRSNNPNNIVINFFTCFDGLEKTAPRKARPTRTLKIKAVEPILIQQLNSLMLLICFL